MAIEKNFNTERHVLTAAIDLAAGSAGGMFCVLLGQPLDTVKVKMQTFPNLYKNSLICLKQTFINDGIKGLYAGTVPAIAANVAENSVLFCAYGVCQKLVQHIVKKEDVKLLSPLDNAIAGCIAAFFSSVSLCPTELIKCRLQAMRETHGSSQLKKMHIGPWKLTRGILKQDGIFGLFRGFWPTVAREMPGYFFFFGGYEVSRGLLTPKGKSKEDIGVIKTSIAGGTGGLCFWVTIFPADLIKSRMQISNSNKSMVAVFREILRTEGVKALYNGIGPTLIRTFPATGVLFVTYEYTKFFLQYLFS